MLSWRFGQDGAENAIYMVVIEKNKGDWFCIEEKARLSDCCRDSQLERQSLQLVFPFVSVAFLSTVRKTRFRADGPTVAPCAERCTCCSGQAELVRESETAWCRRGLTCDPDPGRMASAHSAGILPGWWHHCSSGTPTFDGWTMRYSIGLIARHQEPGVGLRALPVGDLRPVGAADPLHQRRVASYHEKLSTYESPWVRPYGRLELLPATSLRVRGSRLSSLTRVWPGAPLASCDRVIRACVLGFPR